jgi:hypothetical protein
MRAGRFPPWELHCQDTTRRYAAHWLQLNTCSEAADDRVQRGTRRNVRGGGAAPGRCLRGHFADVHHRVLLAARRQAKVGLSAVDLVRNISAKGASCYRSLTLRGVGRARLPCIIHLCMKQCIK